VITKFNFSIFITDDHKVYVCGWNSYSVLGFAHTENVTKITRYPLPDDVKIIDGGCGGCSILLITDRNEIYVSGWNSCKFLYMFFKSYA
jgi:alpha-tubulin suppressor-like RCC1 family protein